MFHIPLLLTLLQFILVHAPKVYGDEPSRKCKPIPSSSDWPSVSQWDALNSSVAGALVVPIPIGAVCHSDWPVYNTSACSEVASRWSDTSFHAADPFTVDYNDISCLPRTEAPCSAVGYPAYVIEARSVEDVQAGVNFARETGVRLVIKNTGHDYLGRYVAIALLKKKEVSR